MLLEVYEGDIAAIEADAVVNAANDHLWMGAGVAGALKRAGGDEIEREAMALGPIAVGTAVATGAGSELRRSLGTAVLFGMIGVTAFGLLFTPAFYTFIRTLGSKRPK